MSMYNPAPLSTFRPLCAIPTPGWASLGNALEQERNILYIIVLLVAA